MALVLEDGFMLFGERGGQATHSNGEVVINTCMTGYQEVLSDPSYAGQMVVMTYPLIGNYGATPDFMESARPWARALITRQLSPYQEHWRSHQSLVEQDLVRQVSEGFNDVVEPLDEALGGAAFRQWPGRRIVVVDYGVKRNTLRSLRARGVDLEVLPWDSDLEAILAKNPDGVVLSNG